MKIPLKLAPALALTAALVAAAPAAAHDHGGPPHGRGGARPAAAATRVTQQARLAVRAVDRAGERIDDGDTAKAISQLAAARRHLAAAQRTTLKKLSGDSGPGSVAVLLDADAQVASQAAGLFDGQDGTTVDALATTLGAALDGRDAVIAAVTALDDDAEADYADIDAAASDGFADELDAYSGAIDDDTLTDAAKTALTGATKQATSTNAALDARVTALGDGSGDQSDGEGDDAWDGPPPPPFGHGA